MIARKSWLPEGGENLFQSIKAKCKEAEEKGIKLHKLSIGQPQGSALESAKTMASISIKSHLEAIHEYQDNGSPGIPDFAYNFVQAHIDVIFCNKIGVDFLPIPGIKPMLGLVPLACGAAKIRLVVRTMTSPGYPTPADWCNYLSLIHYPLSINPDNEFLFSVDQLENNLTDLLMLNYPHNPTGQIAIRQWWHKICAYCADKGIRVFNDAAYAILTHSSEACTLTDVAAQYPNLSWAEAFSASKAIGNGTGWRIGAMVGSSDFIGDIKTIKGNTDSGFVASMAAGVIYAMMQDRKSIGKLQQTYQERLSMLIEALKEAGMRLTVMPKAGFFSLWLTPKKAFGQEIKSAKEFNYLMIEKTGVVGVHFEPYIRYAVCGEVEDMIEDIKKAFLAAKVSYN